MGQILFPFAMKEFREAKEVQRIGLRKSGFLRIEQRIDFCKKSGKPAEVHLIVLHHAGERLSRGSTQIFEVILRDHRGGHVVFAMPTKPAWVQNVALQFHQAHGTQSEAP